MAQVVEGGGYDFGNRLKGALQSLGRHGVGVQQWERGPLVDQRLALEIHEAMKAYEREEIEFQQRIQERAQRIQLEGLSAQRQGRIDDLRLKGYEMDNDLRQAEQADAKTLSEAGPFDQLLSSPNLPPDVAEGLKAAKGTFAKIKTPAAQELYLKRILPGVSRRIDQSQREQFKAGIADRASRMAYGEDEGIQEGLKQLAEATDATDEKGNPAIPMQQLLAQEGALRKSLIDSQAKMAKKQRLLAYFTQQAAGISPGPQADRAERAVLAYQAEAIDEAEAQKEIAAAQTGVEPQKPARRPEELYFEAAGLAQKFASPLATPDDVLALTDRFYQKALELQQLGQPQARERSPGSNQRGGLPFEQSPSSMGASANAGAPSATPVAPSAGTGGAPATPPEPTAAVEQAKQLTQSGQKRSEAVKAAEEAARNGASDEELRALLEAAGIDPDAPASSLEEPKPKKKRRQAERVGPNV